MGGTTKQRLVRESLDFIEERGYLGFSYADLADSIGIRKASIHYHFPGKADLSRACLAENLRRMRALNALVAGLRGTGRYKIAQFARRIFRPLASAGRVCLHGVMSAEYAALSEETRLALAESFVEVPALLTEHVQAGLDDGSLRLAPTVLDNATQADATMQSSTAFIGALQGALQVSRIRGVAYFDSIVRVQMDALFPARP